jgi:uncharacterized LabA/DUF88 family protein
MRAAVFVDGSNFYFKLKSLTAQLSVRPRLLEFEFGAFTKKLVVPHTLSEVRYYLGAIKQDEKDEKGKQLYTDQQRLLRLLQRQQVSVVLGHIIQHPDKSFHEKGVDVRIAVEMIRLAREDRYDVAYLLSSDTDLVPAVEEVQSFNKKVCYVGISKGQSYGLSKKADDVKLLRPEDITPFFKSAAA